MSQTDGTGWRPEHEIEVIAGTPAGGGQDRAARALASSLRETLEVPVLVSNVPGRGGGNAWDLLETHAGDGHRLSISSPTLITNRLTGVSTLGLDTLTQIAILYSEFIAFAVPADSPLVTAADLLEQLRSPQPPKVSLATARGNINHIALAYLCRHVGTDPADVHISVFDSAPDAIADAVGHSGGVAAVSAASVMPYLTSGSLRVLGVSSPTRLADPLDTVPSFAELGVDCTIGVWRGVVGPPALESDIVSFWSETIAEVVAGDAWRTALRHHVWSDLHLARPATTRFMKTEDERMRSALSDFGLLDN